jgi:ABC-2 type transport system permease protein
MNKTARIVRHELITALRRPSFLLVALGIPLLVLLIVALLTFAKRGSNGTGYGGSGGSGFAPQVEGYVDQSGLIESIPDSVPRGRLLAYASEEQARQALAAGQIAAYYVIPADYIETGELFYVYPDGKSLTSDGQEWLMLRPLLTNLLGGDDDLAQWVWDPIDLSVTNLTPESEYGGDRSNELLRIFPFMMVGLLYASIMINSNLLAESVSSEKANRTIEVLMLSVTPRQMLAGKAAGLGIAALIQTVAWLGAVTIAMTAGGQALGLPRGFTFPASLLVWGLLFFLLGFAIYASLTEGGQPGQLCGADAAHGRVSGRFYRTRG